MLRPLSEIWPEIRAGDASAWKELVRRYSGLVHTVAVRCGLSELDAEDCAQYVWMNLYRHRHRLREPNKVPSWLTRACKRRAMRVLSTIRRAQSEALITPEEPPAAPPDEELIEIEHQIMIREAMEHLDDRCRLLLINLFYSPDDKTYEELAAQLKVSTNAVGPIRSRCLKRLKKILKNMGYEVHE